MRLAWVVLVVAASAAADPKRTDPKVSALLREGRAHQAKHEYTAAIAAFDKALALAPDDATVLTELGWTAYLAKDLARAEEATRKALANQSAANVRGASLYNLGLIAKARGDTRAAIAAWSESLEVRPNGTVREALRALDPAAASELFISSPLGAADACAGLPPKQDWYGDTLSCRCTHDTKELTTRTCSATPGGTDYEVGFTQWILAVQLRDKVASAVIEQRTFGRDCYASDQHVKITGMHEQDVVPGGEPELLVDVASTGTCWHGDLDWQDEQLVVVAGGKATRITTKRLERQDADPDVPVAKWPVTTDVALTVRWESDGRFTLGGRTKGLDKAEAASILGTHALP